jgi:hypothetical protein
MGGAARKALRLRSAVAAGDQAGGGPAAE